MFTNLTTSIRTFISNHARGASVASVLALALATPTIALAQQASPDQQDAPPTVAQAADQPAVQSEPSFLMGSVGGGAGVPYGVIGGGITIGTDYLSLIGGVGTTVLAGPGYGAGLRAHFLNSSHKWRPHLTAVYGTTTVYQISGDVDLKGTLHGMAFYLGVDHDFGGPGGWFATYGLGYITHEDLPQSVKNTLASYGKSAPDMGTPIKLMVGIGYRIGGY